MFAVAENFRPYSILCTENSKTLLWNVNDGDIHLSDRDFPEEQNLRLNKIMMTN